jgi:hypothetical protein
MLPAGGYAHGVEAKGKWSEMIELHAPFDNIDDATLYRDQLAKTQSSVYEYVKVVKIELTGCNTTHVPDPDAS